jgi:translation elongation factor EF-1alpha
MAPLPTSVRFRIDDVHSIVGEACVAVRELEEGTLQVPTRLKLLPGEPRPEAPAVVTVVRAEAHHKHVERLQPGVTAGLTLRGVDGERLMPGCFARRCPVKKGDRLVSP